MSDLIVVGFDTPDEADKVLVKLAGLKKEYLIDLEDAVVVVRDEAGKVHLKQSLNLTAIGASSGLLSGALWGGLVGLLFLNPLAGFAIGGAVGAGAGALSGSLSDYGIDDNFIKSLGETIPNNSSALFVLVRKVQPEKVLAELEGLPERGLGSRLHEQVAQVIGVAGELLVRALAVQRHDHTAPRHEGVGVPARHQRVQRRDVERPDHVLVLGRDVVPVRLDEIGADVQATGHRSDVRAFVRSSNSGAVGRAVPFQDRRGPPVEHVLDVGAGGVGFRAPAAADEDGEYGKDDDRRRGNASASREPVPDPRPGPGTRRAPSTSHVPDRTGPLRRTAGSADPGPGSAVRGHDRGDVRLPAAVALRRPGTAGAQGRVTEAIGIMPTGS